ncbi:MAG: aspartate aminotransferase family protein [Acidimicrobiales bacterium]|nr:aspartate aminotransferase family protein [Acidimicrobiales bacterium]MCB1260315.1 aspartate aminotransferase family protein [Acidimicrobiales bacterium]
MPTRFFRPFARPVEDRVHTIVRGSGAVVWDADGNRYVDALAALWFCQAGHGRADIADAVADQLRTLEAFHCFERFTNPVAEELCERLADGAPVDDARVLLTSSGSEAVDSALKVVRLTFDLAGDPDRHVVVSRVGAYHGVTFGGMSVQGLAANQAGFGPLLPGIVTVPDDELDATLDALGDRVAAVITEPVQGAGGVHPPTRDFLGHLRRRCDELGALLVLDEVITGFGRLGRRWAADHYGVRPDLVTFAKGVTSGYQPLGGVLVGARVREVLEADPTFVFRHGHTYSGHPAAARAALANLDAIEREGLEARALHIGSRLEPELRALEAAGTLTEVRGLAGIWGVTLPEGIDAFAVRDAMMRAGVIVRPLGPSVIGICPPLVIDDHDLDRCATALGEAVTAVRSGTTTP